MINQLENMDKRLKYFSETFPQIWEKFKDQITEKSGVYLVMNQDSDLFPTNLTLFPGLSEEEITSVENGLGIKFPTEYRNFLLNYNGLEFFDNFVLWGIKKTYNKKDYISQRVDLIKDQKEYGDGWNISEAEVIIASDENLGTIYVLDSKTGRLVAHDPEFPDEKKEYGSFNQFINEVFEESLESLL